MKRRLITTLIISSLFIGSLGALHTSAAEFDVNRAWKKSCRKCHDKDGSGGTPAGKKLHVEDYTKADVQASFSDEEAIRVIREGVTGDNGKSRMDAYPDFTDEEVAALVELIRSFEATE